MRNRIIGGLLVGLMHLMLVQSYAAENRIPWKRDACKRGLKGAARLNITSPDVVARCLRDLRAERLPPMSKWGVFQTKRFLIYVFAETGTSDSPLFLYFQDKITKQLAFKCRSTFDLD